MLDQIKIIKELAIVNLWFSVGIWFKENFTIVCPNIGKPIGFFSLSKIFTNLNLYKLTFLTGPQATSSVVR